MSKYIDKDKVLEYIIFEVVGKDITCGDLARGIESLPTIEVSDDCISRQQMIEVTDKLYLWIDERGRELLEKTIKILPPVTPTVKAQQADTLIIATALRDFAQDSERNISDRERAEKLREQVLAYGASMCKPVTPTEQQEHGRLIDADKLLQEMFTVDEEEWTTPEIRAILEKCPTVITPMERTGRWVKNDHRLLEYQKECSLCGESTIIEPRYCPNCGAKMGGDTE